MFNQRRKKVFLFNLSVCLLLAVAWLLGISEKSFGQSFDYPLIFDLDVCPAKAGVPAISPFTTAPYGFHQYLGDVTPVPLAGTHLAANDWRVTGCWDACYSQNRAVGVTLTGNTGPIHGTVDPNALITTMNYLSSNNMRLDFVLADIEPFSASAVQQDTIAMVQQVRGHADPNINQAFVGNYGFYPGVHDESKTYPSTTYDNNTVQDSFYNTNGLNAAMPVAYQWGEFEVHADSNLWRTTHYYSWDIAKLFPYYTYERVSPNKQSALFWGSLERVSTAARALPAGHKLIPWVGGYIPRSAYTPIPLPHEDEWRLIQHYRLRGVDGYYSYRSLDNSWYNPDIPSDINGNETRKAAYLDAWVELDWLFDGVDEDDVEILNLATNKGLGLQWSGVQTPNGTVILYSYQGNYSSLNLDYAYIQQKLGLPDLPPVWTINNGEHMMYMSSAYSNADLFIDNGGIEDGTGTAASNWTVTGVGRIERSSDMAKSGTWSMKLSPEPGYTSSTSSYPAAYQDFDVSGADLEGETLEVSVYTYNPSSNPITGNDVSVRLKILLFDDSGNVLAEEIQTAVDDSSSQDTWTLTTATVVAPAGVASVRAELQMYYKYLGGPTVGGVAYCDSMLFNFLPLEDGGFEDGVNDIAFYWTGTGNDRAVRSDLYPKSGRYSLRFQPDYDYTSGSSAWASVKQEIDVSDLDIMGDTITVSTNGYNPSGQPLAGNVHVNLKITLYDASNTVLGQGVTIAMSDNSTQDQWIPATASVVAPAGVDHIEIELQMVYKYDGRTLGGAVHFDNVKTNIVP